MGLSLIFTGASFVNAQQVELTIAHTTTGGPDADVLNEVIASFEAANPNIKIVQVTQDDDLYEDAGLITMLKSNDPPDIYFQWGGALVARDAEEGFSADLTDVLNETGWIDTFVEAAWSPSAGTVHEGRIHLIPYGLDVTTAIWYNQDIFEEFGLDEPATWAEFVELADTLQQNGVTPFIFGNNELWTLGNWAGHLTARMVSPETFDAAFRLQEPFSQPSFVQAFELLEQMRGVNAFNPDMPGLGADPAMIGFFQGAAAMHPIGSWLVSEATDNAPEDFRYGVFNTPPIAGGAGEPTSVIGLSTGFEVSASTEHFDEAIAFLQFFTSLENQVAWAEAGTFSPVVGAMDAANLDPHTKELAALFDSAGAIVPPPDTGYLVEVADVFYQGAAFVAGGVRSPEDALDWIDDQLEPLR
jgi:raffinose/stachyose/melibiose transport system substrate-binding protein